MSKHTIKMIEYAPEEEEKPGLGWGAKGKASYKLYTLVVYVVGGPVGGEFEGQTISRTIQIRGDQTLEKLHKAIFKAFDRFDEHLYEFILSVGPDDRTVKYSLPMDVKVPWSDKEIAGDVRTTTIDSLGLGGGPGFWISL